MRKYNFEVKFTVPIEAESYDQAVRKADKQFPDVEGMTSTSGNCLSAFLTAWS